MNYSTIAAAVEHYRARGYAYVQDAPWNVGAAAYYATKPKDAKDVVIMDESVYGEGFPTKGYLVASGEQSFVQMMLDGQPLKRAVCVTPCFRIEQYNVWHRPYFMKVELINAHDVDDGHLLHMVHEACSFFEGFLPHVRIVKTGVGYDIIEKDSRMELGSYGIRDMIVVNQRLRWIYGTGCAEPRLSTVIERFRRDRASGSID